MIIVRYSEIALKGKNRPVFERKLVVNIKDCLAKQGIHAKIFRKRGRIFIETDVDCDLSCVFGISSFSKATQIKFDIDAIKTVLDSIVGNEETFRISANRGDKSVEIKSMDINILLGQYIVDKHKKKVNLTKPDLDIGIDIIEGNAHIFTTKTAGQGGLPYGVNSTAHALISTDQSIAAAWLLMRRGVRILPFADENQDISLLQKFSLGYPMELEIRKIPQEGVLVVDQTLTSLENLDTKAMVLRPLIGHTEQEIDELLKFIKK